MGACAVSGRSRRGRRARQPALARSRRPLAMRHRDAASAPPRSIRSAPRRAPRTEQGFSLRAPLAIQRRASLGDEQASRLVVLVWQRHGSRRAPSARPRLAPAPSAARAERRVARREAAALAATLGRGRRDAKRRGCARAARRAAKARAPRAARSRSRRALARPGARAPARSSEGALEASRAPPPPAAARAQPPRAPGSARARARRRIAGARRSRARAGRPAERVATLLEPCGTRSDPPSFTMAGPSSADLDRMMRETQEAMRRLEAAPAKAKGPDLDDLIRDSDAKLEQIQRWKEGKHPLGFFQRLRRGFAHHQGRWGDVLFAGVVFGLAVERLVEKKQTDVRGARGAAGRGTGADGRARAATTAWSWTGKGTRTAAAAATGGRWPRRRGGRRAAPAPRTTTRRSAPPSCSSFSTLCSRLPLGVRTALPRPQALREELSEAKERAEAARTQLELATEEWRSREGDLASDLQRALDGSRWGLAKATREALEAHRRRVDQALAAVDQDGVVVGRRAADGAPAAAEAAAVARPEAEPTAEPAVEARAPKPAVAPKAEVPEAAADAAPAAKPPAPQKDGFMI